MTHMLKALTSWSAIQISINLFIHWHRGKSLGLPFDSPPTCTSSEYKNYDEDC